MSKRSLIILLLGIIGLLSIFIFLPLAGNSASLISRAQKCLMNNYGGTAERELDHILSQHQPEQLSIVNILKYTIHQALDQGIAPTFILILFSLPLIGTLSDILHYMVGLEGYGIYIPGLIAASFWSIGILGGLVLFFFILGFSLIVRNLLYKIKLHYWPRRSISLWMVVIGVFVFLSFLSDYFVLNPAYVSVFSILFLILLAEEHISVQRRKSVRVAIQRTIVTLFLAILSTLGLSWYSLQTIILGYPELFMVIVLGLSFIVGRYTGFRLLEYRRFSSVIRKESEEE